MNIRQSEVFPYYRKCCDYFNRLYAYLQTLYNDTYAEELCKMRGYVDDDHLRLFRDMKIGYCSVLDTTDLGDLREELGLVTKEDGFLLNERFIIPVYDVAGNLVSMIGYYADFMKYITIASPFFSKNTMFLNFRQAYETSWNQYNGFVILVEGVFDCLSLRSIGLPAIATMGSDVTSEKAELLKLFRKVIAIPDDDKTGRKALDRYSKYGWKVPSNTTMIKFVGSTLDFNGTFLHCKDMDNFVSWYEKEDVIESLLQFQDSREDVEILKI